MKRKSVSVLPSCVKPKPRTDGPLKPLSPWSKNGEYGMPYMPTFWYRFRRCGILKSCTSLSKLENPSVPKNPCVGLRRWHPLQVWKVSIGLRLKKTSSPRASLALSESSSARSGFGG